MKLSAKQLECLRALAATKGPASMFDFASGTLSSLRKAGLIEREVTRAPSKWSGRVEQKTVYSLTAFGEAALAAETPRPGPGDASSICVACASPHDACSCPGGSP